MHGCHVLGHLWSFEIKKMVTFAYLADISVNHLVAALQVHFTHVQHKSCRLDGNFTHTYDTVSIV